MLGLFAGCYQNKQRCVFVQEGVDNHFSLAFLIQMN